MMSLIPCHHFSAQHVLSVDDEPLVVSGAGNDLFVATARCSVNHYVMTSNASEESEQCKFIGSFPSVATVNQMAYSEKGERTVMTCSRSDCAVNLYYNYNLLFVYDIYCVELKCH